MVENRKNIHGERMKNSVQQNSVKEVWSGVRNTVEESRGVQLNGQRTQRKS